MDSIDGREGKCGLEIRIFYYFDYKHSSGVSLATRRLFWCLLKMQRVV